MTNKHGDFIWYELLTTDVDAAARFYGTVIGWQSRAMEEADNGYRLFAMGSTDIAGFMPVPAKAEGMRPGWLGYVGVDNVDEAAADIVQAGGAQHMPPTDIPGVGRFALLADPQGVPFYVMRGASEETSTSFSPNGIGHCQWNELSTSDPAAALAFYKARFGWEKGDAMPMGEMGDYQFINQGDQTIGAVMRHMPGGPPPMWNFYFGIADIDAAAQAVSGTGGSIHYGPAEVPGNIYIIVASDPQGALFGLVGPRKS
ncbi:VOC family protein [Microvirga arabica]|uniref:VOC family protein n=1 Tax=Microvirga arabica TaxID=1128671 RepID=A0ABV6YE25_9HYPH